MKMILAPMKQIRGKKKSDTGHFNPYNAITDILLLHFIVSSLSPYQQFLAKTSMCLWISGCILSTQMLSSLQLPH